MNQFLQQKTVANILSLPTRTLKPAFRLVRPRLPTRSHQFFIGFRPHQNGIPPRRHIEIRSMFSTKLFSPLYSTKSKLTLTNVQILKNVRCERKITWNLVDGESISHSYSDRRGFDKIRIKRFRFVGNLQILCTQKEFSKFSNIQYTHPWYAVQWVRVTAWYFIGFSFEIACFPLSRQIKNSGEASEFVIRTHLSLALYLVQPIELSRFELEYNRWTRTIVFPIAHSIVHTKVILAITRAMNYKGINAVT